MNDEHPDLEKALEVSVRACDLGGTVGCENAAWVCDQGIDDVPNPICAVAYAERACDGGSATGCYYLGRHYESGDGNLQKNVGRAMELFEVACNGADADACVAAGTYAQGGAAGKTNRAATLFRRACDLGSEAGCDRAKQYGSSAP